MEKQKIAIGSKWRWKPYTGFNQTPFVYLGPCTCEYKGFGDHWLYEGEVNAQHRHWPVVDLNKAFAVVPAGALTIEERRAALKVGDLIKDPELLCKGMRVRWELYAGGPDTQATLGTRWDIGWTAVFDNGSVAKVPVFRSSSFPLYPAVFLGWATEEKPVEAPATDAPPKPKALPFRYVDGCLMIHNGTVCLNCENIIAKAMDARQRLASPRPPQREPYEPLRTGLGNGIVGGWNKRAVK